MEARCMSEHFAVGIHDLSSERYDAAEGISCSMLNVLAEGTPAHLKAWMNGERKETEALQFGVLAHLAILQGDLYKKKFHVVPEGVKLTTKEGKKWADDHQDKPIVKWNNAQILTGMVEAVRYHPFAQRLLYNGKPEQSLFVYDEQDTLRKSRLDTLTEGNALADIKSCASASNDYFERQILKFRYHVRAAYYLDNARLLGLEKDHFFFVAVEKTPPFAVRCLRLDGDCVSFGRKLYQADLQIYRQCLESDEWPGYSQQYEDIALPSFAMKQIWELI
jgi:hypothetical protein